MQMQDVQMYYNPVHYFQETTGNLSRERIDYTMLYVNNDTSEKTVCECTIRMVTIRTEGFILLNIKRE